MLVGWDKPFTTDSKGNVSLVDNYRCTPRDGVYGRGRFQSCCIALHNYMLPTKATEMVQGIWMTPGMLAVSRLLPLGYACLNYHIRL